MSSVAKEGRGSFSSCMGGQGSLDSAVARLRRMVSRVLTMHVKAAVERMATPDEYPIIPQNKLDTPTPARTPATAVDAMTMSAVGTHNIQCLFPNETGFPSRRWRRVMAATMIRQVCLIVKASQRRTDVRASSAPAAFCAAPMYSDRASQTNTDRERRSNTANQTCALSEMESVLKFGRPNSFCSSFKNLDEQQQRYMQRLTGATRLLRG